MTYKMIKFLITTQSINFLLSSQIPTSNVFCILFFCIMPIPRSESYCLPTTNEVFRSPTPASPPPFVDVDPQFMKDRRKGIIVSLAALVSAFVGFSLVNPLFTEFLSQFSNKGSDVGLVIGIFAVFQFIFSPVLGKLSDKYGRKLILSTSLFLLSLCLFATGFGNSVMYFVILRSITGSVASLTSVTQAYLADVTLPSERSQYMGLAAAGQGLSLSFGPVLGGILFKQFDFFTVCAVGSVFVFLSFVGTLLWFKNPPKMQSKSQSKKSLKVKNGVNWYAFCVVLVATLFNWIFIANEQAIVPLLLIRVLDGTTLQYSLWMAFSGVVVVIFQVYFLKAFVNMFKKDKESKSAALASFIFVIISLTLTLLYKLPFKMFFFFLTVIPKSVAKSTVVSTSNAIASFFSDDTNKGKILGIVQSISALGRSSPIVMSVLFDVHHTLPNGITTVLLLVSVFLFLWVKKYVPKIEEDEEEKEVVGTELENIVVEPLATIEEQVDDRDLKCEIDCDEHQDEENVEIQDLDTNDTVN
ncbi:hypothetical protein RCL1_003729 [Eukaryota sp. TZLM3-RCL]